jgi:DNA-nicking Smr family endonuclease
MNARRRGEEILRYIELHGVRDKDAGSVSGSSRSGKQTIARGPKGRFRKTIDLHGMDSITAERALMSALSEAKKRGITELLIIHGRGMHSDGEEGGVLKKLVRDNLEFRYGEIVRTFGPALPREGGDGATLVRLR